MDENWHFTEKENIHQKSKIWTIIEVPCKRGMGIFLKSKYWTRIDLNFMYISKLKISSTFFILNKPHKINWKRNFLNIHIKNKALKKLNTGSYQGVRDEKVNLSLYFIYHLQHNRINFNIIFPMSSLTSWN